MRYEVNMNKIIIAFFLLLASAQALSNELCDIVAGATVIANDGQYLGVVSSEYDSDSIFNDYGTYGSPYSATSIWNDYGTYGGEYSSMSPFNRYTSTPPILVKNGEAIAHLTVNRTLEAPVNPYVLKSCTFY